jgi:hypothetical protein
MPIADGGDLSWAQHVLGLVDRERTGKHEGVKKDTKAW